MPTLPSEGSSKEVYGTITVSGISSGGAASGDTVGSAAGGDVILAGGVYNTTLTAVDAGDATALQTDEYGRLIVVGHQAHDGALSAEFAGRPVLLGAYASTATPSAVSGDGDLSRMWVDRNGRLIVAGGAPHDSAAAGNPVLQGAYANATAPTAVTDGDALPLP